MAVINEEVEGEGNGKEAAIDIVRFVLTTFQILNIFFPLVCTYY